MKNHSIKIKRRKKIKKEQIIDLYRSNEWISAEKPEELVKGLNNSHTLITAWDGEKLIGLGNAISDGFLVVYYPNIIVHADYQKRGIGKLIFNNLQKKYGNFKQQILIANGKAIDFYFKCGFDTASACLPMLKYSEGGKIN